MDLIGRLTWRLKGRDVRYALEHVDDPSDPELAESLHDPKDI